MARASGVAVLNNPAVWIENRDNPPVVGKVGDLSAQLGAATSSAVTVADRDLDVRLATALTAGATSVVCDEAPEGLSNGDVIWMAGTTGELMTVTAVSDKTITVTRGAASTTAQVHAAGSDIWAGSSANGNSISLAANPTSPIGPGDLLRIDDETVRVNTFSTPRTYTVARGYGETVAASHASGADVDELAGRTDLTPWVREASFSVANEAAPATGSGNAYETTIPMERSTWGPLTLTLMKSYTARAVDFTLEPLARTGGPFWVWLRDDMRQATSATNPLWRAEVQALAGYMPVVADTQASDAAVVTVTAVPVEDFKKIIV